MLDHCTPDRTPRDFWAEEPTWKRLFAHVGHDDKARLLSDLGIDVRHLDLDGPADVEEIYSILRKGISDPINP